MTDARDATPSVDVGQLLARADAGEPLLLLDVRNEDEFETWRLEAQHPLGVLHIPYFNFLENPEACIARLPRDREIVVLCAQGGSSAMVVDMLGEAGVPARNVTGGMVAYGEYLQAVPVPVDGAGWQMWQVNRRGKGCLSYVVRAGREAIVVDPSRNAAWYERFVQALGARLVHVLDTHVHADHLSGGPLLAAGAGVSYSVDAGADFELRHAVQPLADGQELRLGDGADTVRVRVMATPGHTPGSTSYLVGHRHLLTGDTLFLGSVGRPDLGGHVREWGQILFHTLRDRFGALPPDTLVLPAHYAGLAEIGPDGVVARRLDQLRRVLPELQLKDEGTFVEAMRAALKSPPPAYAEIIRANLAPTPIDPDRATELELGKNQCAAATISAPS
jgi:glyoxylase-like metal-dependent hydrolase (beta-lactamase superfamily II)/rhodanese-related sulfurtransferase